MSPGTAQPIQVYYLGGNTPSAGTGSTVTFNTVDSAPEAVKLVACVGWKDTAATTVTGVTAGGVAMVQINSVANSPARWSMWELDVAGSLASSSAITATFSAGTADSRCIAAFAIRGCYGATVAQGTNTGGPGTAWNTLARNVTRPGIVFGGAMGTGGTATSAPPATQLEIFDFGITGDCCFTATYRILSTGSPNPNGTFSASLTWAGSSARYVSNDVYNLYDFASGA